MASTSRVPYGRDGNDRAASVASSTTSTRRRATARAASVADSNARMSQEPVASTSRAFTRQMSVASSTPADDQYLAMPTSEASTIPSETPTIAAYKPKARATRADSRTPPPSAAVKKSALTAEQRRQEQLRRQREDEEDDFFTRRADLKFVKKAGPGPRKNSRQPSVHKPETSGAPFAEGSATPPPSSPDKGKQRQLIIDLDDDESDGAVSSGSSAEDSEEDPYAQKRGKVGASAPVKSKKKARVEQRKPSPMKRPIEFSSSSSSSSSSSTYDSSSTPGRNKRKKKKGTKRDSEAAPAPRELSRSLSPIEQLDAHTLANAIANVRRNRPRPLVDDDDDDEITLIRGRPASQAGAPSSTPARSVNGNHEADLGSPSTSTFRQGSVDAFSGPRPFALATLPELREQTEEEKEAKYGPIVVITIEMVFDPRAAIYDGIRDEVRQYESPLEIKMRQKESFSTIFEEVSRQKGMPKDELAFTYDGKNLFSFGTPRALNIMSHATIKGYSKEVLQYVKTHGTSRRLTVPNGQPQILATIADPTPLGQASVGALGIQAASFPVVPGQRQQTPTAGPSGSTAAAAAAPASPVAQASPGTQRDDTVNLALRGGPDQRVLLAVPRSRNVLSVIRSFLRRSGIDPSKAAQCKLIVDGEEVPHGSRIGDLDVEDEDTIDIKVPQ